MLGWHFLTEDKKLRWGTKQKIRKGTVCKVNPPLVLCKHGLHASRKALDALRYAPGPVVCRVKLRGEIKEVEDKACATERKVLAIADATKTLHEFACWCAERALRRAEVSDKRCWDVIKVKRAWLAGKATKEDLRTARGAARGAAQVAAQDAAQVAAQDAAQVAAWDAARDAARDAAWDAARDAAQDAERKTQNRKLTQMLNKLLKESQK